MRKTLLSGLALLAILLMPSGASASTPNAFVAGAGWHANGVQFTISAHSGSFGEDASGTISYKVNGEERIRADVTCVIVTENRAIVTATYTDDQNNSQVIVADAIDNGEPSDLNPDRLRFSFKGAIVPDASHPGCFVPLLPAVPVTQGNIVVNDAQP